jgi:hypothetical protein
MSTETVNNNSDGAIAVKESKESTAVETTPTTEIQTQQGWIFFFWRYFFHFSFSKFRLVNEKEQPDKVVMEKSENVVPEPKSDVVVVPVPTEKIASVENQVKSPNKSASKRKLAVSGDNLDAKVPKIAVDA